MTTRPVYCRYAFYTLMLVSIVINGVIFKNEDNFYILYIFSALFLGIGFFAIPNWAIASLTTLVVLCRFFLIPEPSYSVISFITYLITYLVISFISVGLMRNAQRIKDEQLSLITTLSKALDTRDAYTSYHSTNTSKYAVAIAEKMNLTKEMIDNIRIGALLHDIGKIGIPEDILTKPSKLTTEEYNVIKKHPEVGYDMIKHVANFKQSGISDIVLYHHERFDGKGYPLGLKGNEIPLPARIVALADAFDAMTSTRVYREQLPLEHVLNEIENNKGTQFDPDVVDAFLIQFDYVVGEIVEEQVS